MAVLFEECLSKGALGEVANNHFDNFECHDSVEHNFLLISFDVLLFESFSRKIQE